MQLLISVAGPADTRAALLGGADVIDAKDPRHGALSPVTLHRLAAIRAAVGEARPLSAALGDAADEHAIARAVAAARSEEHTSELQSPCNLVCRLLLEKKKKKKKNITTATKKKKKKHT